MQPTVGQAKQKDKCTIEASLWTLHAEKDTGVTKALRDTSLTM